MSQTTDIITHGIVSATVTEIIWTIPMKIDPDDELQAWQIANAESDGRAANDAAERHRCPIDMPPCPQCEAIYEHEDWIEHGAS